MSSVTAGGPNLEPQQPQAYTLNPLRHPPVPSFPKAKVGEKILDSPADGSQMLQNAEEELPLQAARRAAAALFLGPRSLRGLRVEKPYKALSLRLIITLKPPKLSKPKP